jgi:hypothetical protein
MEQVINKVKIVNFSRVNFSDSRWLIGSAGAASFWYISLFPGRIGADPVAAVQLIEQGKSTDWWTALYFWFLRITTFNGQSIWLTSLFSIITLYCSMIYILYSLPEKRARIDRIAFFMCISPLFGNFAVNINHDVFFTSGIFLILGYSLRVHLKRDRKFDKFVPYLSIVLFLNSKTGYVLILCLTVYVVLVHKNAIRAFGLILLSVFIFAVTSLGVTKTTVPFHYLPFLADIKCVTQHAEARVTDNQWKYLEQISSIENWKEPTTCSSMDLALDELASINYKAIQPIEFMNNYLSIATKNPAIVIQAHLQRGSIALPPPFFQGPQNQVDRDVNNPVGLNTNIALQLGPEVLHPSIDYLPLKLDINFLKPLESIALLGSFLVNQASWFWGWGGLWLWPIFIYFLFRLKERNPLVLIKLTYPIIITHAALIAIGPIPAPRYVMSTILVGNIVLLFLLSELFANTKGKFEKT